MKVIGVNATTIKLIGSYEIIGGTLGIYELVIFLKESRFLINPILATIVFIVFAFSILSGLFLIIKDKILKGVKFSLINQALQILHIKIIGLTFSYLAGVFAGVNVSITSPSFFLFNIVPFASDFSLSFFAEDKQMMFSINFIALILFIVFRKLKKKLDEDEEYDWINSSYGNNSDDESPKL